MKVLHLLAWLVSASTLVWSGCSSSDGAEQHYETGLELQEDGHLHEAIAEFDAAITLDPGHFSAYNQRGRVYTNLANYQLAIVDLDEAINLNKDFSEGYINRGLTLFYLGDN